jgi:hypothetical protein
LIFNHIAYLLFLKPLLVAGLVPDRCVILV